MMSLLPHVDMIRGHCRSGCAKARGEITVLISLPLVLASEDS